MWYLYRSDMHLKFSKPCGKKSKAQHDLTKRSCDWLAVLKLCQILWMNQAEAVYRALGFFTDLRLQHLLGSIILGSIYWLVPVIVLTSVVNTCQNVWWAIRWPPVVSIPVHWAKHHAFQSQNLKLNYHLLTFSFFFTLTMLYHNEKKNNNNL